MTIVPGKRGFDLMIAGAGLLLVAPLLVAIALAIRLRDGAPVLFRQRRVGRRGQGFEILKFRTMRSDGGSGPQITVGADSRITPIGRVLRASKLDELPQLLNILRGEMSLVGLRPEVPRYVAGYTREQRAILARRPGLTDPASIRFRDESALLALARDPERCYRERLVPRKLALSLRFARGEDLAADWRVLWRTLRPGRAA